VIGGFYIGECYCILHALGLKKNLAEFNLVDFHNSPNRQNKFYTKFSSYTVYGVITSGNTVKKRKRQNSDIEFHIVMDGVKLKVISIALS